MALPRPMAHFHPGKHCPVFGTVSSLSKWPGRRLRRCVLFPTRSATLQARDLSNALHPILTPAGSTSHVHLAVCTACGRVSCVSAWQLRSILMMIKNARRAPCFRARAQSARLTHGRPIGKCAWCACRTCCLTEMVPVLFAAMRRSLRTGRRAQRHSFRFQKETERRFAIETPPGR